MGKGGARKPVGQAPETVSNVIDKYDKPRTEYFMSYTDEPHVTRRKLILEKHPEIAELFGNDPRVVPVVLAIVAMQLTLAYFSYAMSWPVYILTAWILGGAASHSLMLMTHEVSHNLVFKTPLFNDLFGIFCNIGMGVPSSTLFKRYHIEHHQFQGFEEYDMDIPTKAEGELFNSPIRKVFFLIFQFAFYGLRPQLVRPKSPSKLDIMNNIVIFSSNIAIYMYFPSGLSALGYLVASSLLGMGLHPCAGHFISEHYVFPNDDNLLPDGMGTKSIFDIPMMRVTGNGTDAAKNPVIPVAETYSYYGALNLLCWNVGYHNEHHDFPRVPGWKLPQVHRIAKEFYEHLPQHKSWTWVLISYVMNPNVTAYSRVVRNKVDMMKHKDIVEKQLIGVNTTGSNKLD